jgi:hypothetical protein
MLFYSKLTLREATRRHLKAGVLLFAFSPIHILKTIALRSLLIFEQAWTSPR